MEFVKRRIECVAVVLVALTGFWACETFQPAVPPAALVITPERAALSPALMKEPIRLNGAGFQPNETVVVDLIVPKGVTVKGLGEGDGGRVGIANAVADDQGSFSATVGPSTLLNTFFQVEWNPETMKPDFGKAKPLPPGVYEIVATGAFSERTGKATLELLPPPAQK
jgi:hypothetical protein